MAKKTFRLFLGPCEIAGIFSRLKKGLLALGHDVYFFAPSEHSFNYPGIDSISPELSNIFELERIRFESLVIFNKMKIGLRKKAIPAFVTMYFKLLFSKAKNIFLFLKYAMLFDAFIFQYGNSLSLKSNLVRFDDLFWLKLFRRKVIFLLCGSDSRPVWVDGALLNSLQTKDPTILAETTKQIAENISAIEKGSHFIISNIFSSYFLTKKTIALQAIGNATHLPSKYKQPPKRIRPIIIHAPSNPKAKGTEYIQKCLTELASEGLEFELELIAGKSNAQVLSAIENCDFVIDQLYSDSPLATFASEAAAFARPAIVGSYISTDEYKIAFELHGCPPSAICAPTELKSTIKKLIVDIDFRAELGLRAREYVENVLKPEKVAERYIKLIEGKPDKNWAFDPNEVMIVPPAGLDKVTAAKILQDSFSVHDGNFFLPKNKPIIKSFSDLAKASIEK